MPEDSLALILMPNVDLPNILKITCEVMSNPHESRKFNFQIIETSNYPSCRANIILQIKTDKVDANDTKANIPYYFRSSINRAADKRASEVLTKHT